MIMTLYLTSSCSDVDEDKEDEERCTDSSNLSDTEDHWFELIDANANWTNIHTYLNSGSNSDADSDTNSNPDANWDSNVAAESDSNPEPALDLTRLVQPEPDVDWDHDYLDFSNIEPITPQLHAFEVGGPIVVYLIPVFRLIIISYN